MFSSHRLANNRSADFELTITTSKGKNMNFNLNTQTFATPDGSGGYILSPAAQLLIFGSTLYGDPAETTPEGLMVSSRFIDEFISAAVAGGFRKADILRTRMARGETCRELILLAQEAERAAGEQRLCKLVSKFRP